MRSGFSLSLWEKAGGRTMGTHFRTYRTLSVDEKRSRQLQATGTTT